MVTQLSGKVGPALRKQVELGTYPRLPLLIITGGPERLFGSNVDYETIPDLEDATPFANLIFATGTINSIEALGKLDVVTSIELQEKKFKELTS